jgi:hypothetical protein
MARKGGRRTYSDEREEQQGDCSIAVVSMPRSGVECDVPKTGYRIARTNASAIMCRGGG